MDASHHKVALVTGSATGVGRACALRFAESGYRVVVNYPGDDEAEAQETCRLISEVNSESLLLRCDVSSNSQVQAMVSQVANKFGRLNVVVNNAGTTHFVPIDDLEAMDETKWDQIFAVNTKGPFFVARACRRLLELESDAAIVNVSSVAGISGFGSSIAYCASKGALNTITKSLAKSLAPKIRVNAVCPGPINSRWLRQDMSEAEIEARIATIPIPKLSQPEDIAKTIFYLAVQASMTTGQLLVVDGGRTM
ncbi:MAG: glucose 1-dehydrogenase [Planctomycetota bacterium]